jgi:hypothetical protein
MKPHAKIIAPAVRHEKDLDILGQKSPKWKPSITMPTRMMGDTEVDKKITHFNIRNGMGDNMMVPSNSITPYTYAGCDTREVYDNCGLGWD